MNFPALMAACVFMFLVAGASILLVTDDMIIATVAGLGASALVGILGAWDN